MVMLPDTSAVPSLFSKMKSLFYDTLSIYTFVKVSGLMRKKKISFQYKYIFMWVLTYKKSLFELLIFSHI